MFSKCVTSWCCCCPQQAVIAFRSLPVPQLPPFFTTKHRKFKVSTCDEQGIKRGIVETADLIAVTKADGDTEPAAQRARSECVKSLFSHSNYS